MTLTIDLPFEQEAALKAKAQARGVSAERYAASVLERDLVNAVLPAVTIASSQKSDFSDLVGKWTTDSAFDDVISSQRQIDLDKWK